MAEQKVFTSKQTKAINEYVENLRNAVCMICRESNWIGLVTFQRKCVCNMDVCLNCAVKVKKCLSCQSQISGWAPNQNIEYLNFLDKIKPYECTNCKNQVKRKNYNEHQEDCPEVLKKLCHEIDEKCKDKKAQIPVVDLTCKEQINLEDDSDKGFEYDSEADSY